MVDQFPDIRPILRERLRQTLFDEGLTATEVDTMMCEIEQIVDRFRSRQH